MGRHESREAEAEAQGVCSPLGKDGEAEEREASTGSFLLPQPMGTSSTFPLQMPSASGSEVRSLMPEAFLIQSAFLALSGVAPRRISCKPLLDLDPRALLSDHFRDLAYDRRLQSVPVEQLLGVGMGILEPLKIRGVTAPAWPTVASDVWVPEPASWL